MIKRNITLIGLILFVILLSACAKKEEIEVVVPETQTAKESEEIVIECETEPETESESEPLSETDERVEVDGMIRSYLTGEMVPVEIGNRRPVAVMMSNDKEAAPQYGINRAGVVYEAPVEGTMNRFMSVIEDYDELERIGSVRSCRTYYTYFALEWDAIYAHYGQSTFALPYLDNLDNINGVMGSGGAAFYRSNDKKEPHNAYTSGKLLKKAIELNSYSNDYSEKYEANDGHFKFASGNEEINFDENLSLAADKIYPGYPFNAPWFDYDEEDGLYHRYQYGKEHMGDEGPITVKNVIFQYCPTANYATTQYLNINVHDDGYGYIFTNGRCMPFSCKKDGEFGVTRYYDMEGQEIRLNKGKTWICIIKSSKFEDTEIYDIDGNRTN
ncbi:MAG: DUF3048 domain-containing protein [Lachnospiraceae bacterium]|nr:DUF3048 domain-containing protein [Lachnospiraceae bacterium]